MQFISFLLQDRLVNMTVLVLIRQDPFTATVLKDLQVLVVKSISTNVIQTPVKMKEHVLMKEVDFAVYACQVKFKKKISLKY